METPSSSAAEGLSRRSLLKAGAAGVLLVSFRLPVAHAAGEPFAPNAFIRVGNDDIVTLVMPQVEMGQGIYTTVGMILADELDADFNKVVLEHAPPDEKLFANPVFKIQATGGSTSVRAFWMPLRKAGATARAMLIAAAAQQWKVEPSSCRASNSEVIHDGSGRKLAYGAIAANAATMKPPSDPPLKALKDFTLIGHPIHRKDTPDKTNGKAQYGIDAMPAGVQFATLAECPVFGGKIKRVDDTKAKAIKGVRQVVVLDDLVAVVADTTWTAMQGLGALDVTWDEGPNAAVGSRDVWDALRNASAGEGIVAKEQGDVKAAFADGDRYDAVYELPFLAHATMEPLNCTVHFTKDACELWTGTQVIARVQSEVAKALGLPTEKVTVHNFFIGGGFGRRLEPDMAVKAARIAQHVEGPVKVVWRREEDMQHDVYRPVYHDALAASVKDGKITGWTQRITGSAIIARWLPPAFQKGIDIDAVDGATDNPYGVPNVRVEYIRAEPPGVPTGFWRGVGPNNNFFASESFIDELAHRAGADPVAYRLKMLDATPRLKAAVQLAASKSGWGEPLPARVGRGISAQTAFASFIATVCEAEVDQNGEVRVHRLVSAVDTGIAVNPDTIVAQLEGGLIFGLTAALFSEITIAKGRVEQSNFHDYRMLRINETPKIEVHLISSTEFPGGIGETGTTAAPPALTNALFAATGVRLRRLPIDRDLLAGRKQV
ncbi:xanthine dehydrogenase family protein molybdopterin-binding subunit [Hyphomicrobium sp. 99]|uniref:xanthine dehydrogenase family protein molybdopterin-binding subunit n=1 Tax=Hyphomicrobium sp. 99 TaxID=1163419 RepID=UPI0005F790CF|nr:molybdopterin cofactor-binding domain-containing protein [Hyphomicrobium sp. 99]